MQQNSSKFSGFHRITSNFDHIWDILRIDTNNKRSSHGSCETYTSKSLWDIVAVVVVAIVVGNGIIVVVS